jgi:hypothetical protein
VVDWGKVGRGLLNQPEPKPVLVQPSMAVAVSGEYIFNIINTVLPQTTHIYLSDNAYWLCSNDDIKRFLDQDDTNKYPFINESMDCDDYAYRLAGQLSIPNWSSIAFGILWTELHAQNCFINHLGEFFYIEPQTDAVQIKLEEWQGKEVLMVVM